MILPRTVARELRGKWNDEREICGLVLEDGSTYDIRNVAEDPSHHFKFDIDDLTQCIHAHPGKEIVGIYHSHPNNTSFPSADDIRGWPKAAVCQYWIVTQHAVYEWSLGPDGKSALVR